MKLYSKEEMILYAIIASIITSTVYYSANYIIDEI